MPTPAARAPRAPAAADLTWIKADDETKADDDAPLRWQVAADWPVASAAIDEPTSARRGPRKRRPEKKTSDAPDGRAAGSERNRGTL